MYYSWANLQHKMLLYSKWLSLSLPTRMILASHFGIAKTGPTEVHDNMVKSDGYKIHDVENALTVERMQAYVASQETDHLLLWEAIVAKAEGREIPPPPVVHQSAPALTATFVPEAPLSGVSVVPVVPAEPPVIVTPKPRGRPRKNVQTQ